MTNCREEAVVMLSEESCERRSGLVYRCMKRSFDIVLSLFGIVVLALPLLIIAAAVRLDSSGAAIFRQNRVGKDGRVFKICKFRTMHTFAPSETATGELSGAYSYITRVGRLLRKTSLDELPQLFNILKGDMSVIGPRPLIVGESEIHDLRSAAGVYSVRPGMTGWAQVNGRDNLAVSEKVALDAEYVENLSLAFDLRVLLKTVAVVISGDGYREGRQRSEKNDMPGEAKIAECAEEPESGEYPLIAECEEGDAA